METFVALFGVSAVLLGLFILACNFAFKSMKEEVDSIVNKPRWASKWSDWTHDEWDNWVISQYKSSIARDISAKMKGIAEKTELKIAE